MCFARHRALSHLDGFVRLESLVLDNNSLEDGGFTLPPLLNLTTLCMNNNNLADIESVLNEVSTKAPNVRYLSLLKNPCCPTPIFDAEKDDDDYQRYRYYVLHRLPRLQFLDSNAVSPDELSEAQRVGRFMRVARPEVLKAPAKPREEEVVDYRPLPDDSRPEGAGPARFGVSKYVYYGRQSEGNRFITDENLVRVARLRMPQPGRALVSHRLDDVVSVRAFSPAC